MHQHSNRLYRYIAARPYSAIGGVILSGAIVYALVSGGSVETEARYVLAASLRGDVSSMVSGSGQVSAALQSEVRAKASGDVQSIRVREGQYVTAGELLMQLDASDAQNAVRDAEMNLTSARLSLERLLQSTADIDSILEDAGADIASAFLDMPTIVSSVQEIISGNALNPRNQRNADFYKDFVGASDSDNYPKTELFVSAALRDYAEARLRYDAAFLAYKNTAQSAGSDAVQTLLRQTIAATKSIAQVLKSEQNLLDHLTDYATTYSKALPTIITTYKNTLRTHIGLVSGHSATLSGVENTIANAPLDIRSQELTVAQRENALADAKKNLADYFVRAPFSGTIANIAVHTGDSASAGTAVATMITTDRIAEISLNEVDIARVALGQIAELTFDSAPGVVVRGSVTGLDTIGTVSQGVVTYTATINFAGDNAQIKPGMSVSAAIITETKSGVVFVPSAAVKTVAGTSFVEALIGYETEAPQAALRVGIASSAGTVRIPVVTGLVGESRTEIKEGLTEGQLVIARIIGTGGTAPSTTGQSARIPGIGGGVLRTQSR